MSLLNYMLQGRHRNVRVSGQPRTRYVFVSNQEAPNHSLEISARQAHDLILTETESESHIFNQSVLVCHVAYTR